MMTQSPNVTCVCPPRVSVARKRLSNLFVIACVVLLVFSWWGTAEAAEQARIIHGLFNADNQAVCIVNEEHEVVLWSAGAEKLLGWTAADVEGKDMLFLVPEGYCLKHQESFDSRMQSDEFTHAPDGASAIVIRCNINKADGSTMPARMTLRPYVVPPSKNLLAYLFFWQKTGGRYVAAVIDAKDEVQFLNTFNGRKYGKGAVVGEKIPYGDNVASATAFKTGIDEMLQSSTPALIQASGVMYGSSSAEVSFEVEEQKLQ